VVPPMIVRQEMPAFPKGAGNSSPGVLEVVINESGMVESAVMRGSVNPRYDAIVLSAAKAWRYKPANLSGTPVKFRKLISISVKPDA